MRLRLLLVFAVTKMLLFLPPQQKFCHDNLRATLMMVLPSRPGVESSETRVRRRWRAGGGAVPTHRPHQQRRQLTVLYLPHSSLLEAVADARRQKRASPLPQPLLCSGKRAIYPPRGGNNSPHDASPSRGNSRCFRRCRNPPSHLSYEDATHSGHSIPQQIPTHTAPAPVHRRSWSPYDVPISTHLQQLHTEQSGRSWCHGVPRQPAPVFCTHRWRRRSPALTIPQHQRVAHPHLCLLSSIRSSRRLTTNTILQQQRQNHVCLPLCKFCPCRVPLPWRPLAIYR